MIFWKRKQTDGCWDQGCGWGLAEKRPQGTGWDDGNVLKLDLVVLAQLKILTKLTELYIACKLYLNEAIKETHTTLCSRH